MPEWIKNWWTGLDTAQRWFVMIVIVAVVFYFLITYTMGTNWAPLAQWFTG